MVMGKLCDSQWRGEMVLILFLCGLSRAFQPFCVVVVVRQAVYVRPSCFVLGPACWHVMVTQS